MREPELYGVNAALNGISGNHMSGARDWQEAEFEAPTAPETHWILRSTPGTLTFPSEENRKLVT